MFNYRLIVPHHTEFCSKLDLRLAAGTFFMYLLVIMTSVLQLYQF
jgi:hypothetical protein